MTGTLPFYATGTLPLYAIFYIHLNSVTVKPVICFLPSFCDEKALATLQSVSLLHYIYRDLLPV